MKKVAVIAAVVFTTITLQSCRQSDEVLSPQEAATLRKVQDSSNNLLEKNNATSSNTEQTNNPVSLVDGEILPPPRK